MPISISPSLASSPDRFFCHVKPSLHCCRNCTNQRYKSTTLPFLRVPYLIRLLQPPRVPPDVNPTNHTSLNCYLPPSLVHATIAALSQTQCHTLVLLHSLRQIGHTAVLPRLSRNWWKKEAADWQHITVVHFDQEAYYLFTILCGEGWNRIELPRVRTWEYYSLLVFKKIPKLWKVLRLRTQDGVDQQVSKKKKNLELALYTNVRHSFRRFLLLAWWAPQNL
jgi:hypothetical protein